MTTADTLGVMGMYLILYGWVMCMIVIMTDRRYSLSETIALGILWPLLLLRYIGREWPSLLGRVARDMYRLTAGER